MIILAVVCGLVVSANDMGAFGAYERVAAQIGDRIVWMNWNYLDGRYIVE